MITNTYINAQELGNQYGIAIYRPGVTQLQYLINDRERLWLCCRDLADSNFYLVTVVANDERELEDHCFKIYYLFSHPIENLFFTVEFTIKEGQETYPSIAALFPAVDVFEREIADLFGLFPEQTTPRSLRSGYLHNCYPEGIHPLRRNWSMKTFQSITQKTNLIDALPTGLNQTDPLEEGELFLPVGPIHAGVIEPGNFLFRLGSETIKEIEISLGYTHKGTERIFQSFFSILEGWRLAEKVSGDSSFAHSLAYCKAVEHLARTPLPAETNLLRAIFLELERINNHINDCSALAHDLALEVPASSMAVLREQTLQLCAYLTGSRFLRGINCPGGICLPHPFDALTTHSTIRSVVFEFTNLATLLVKRADFRDRTINNGILPRDTALQLGITGLAARSSGIQRDFRTQHPFGPYSNPQIQALIRSAPEHTELPLHHPIQMTGDIFSRFIQRVIEINTSGQLIAAFISQWKYTPHTQFVIPLELQNVPNFETGIGYVEGWRGDIIYWLMKDKFERIYRCKVRDPSMLNWPALREVLIQKRVPHKRQFETALVDFPLINKSFNLSYSGVDL